MHALPGKILVFEPQAGGHRGEFVRHLLVYLRRLEHPPRCRFVLGHGLLAQSGIRPDAWPVEFVELPAATRRPDAGHRLQDAVADYKPDMTLMFELTPLENWLCRHTLDSPLAGILFVQYPEMTWQQGPLLRRGERWLRFHAKQWKTARWLRRQDWRAVFLLNGERACDYLNRRFANKPVFRPLPDPVPEEEGTGSGGQEAEGREQGPENREQRAENSGRKTFLFPGTVSRRKGIDVWLQALQEVPSALAGQAVFKLAGSFEARERGRIVRQIARLRERRPDVRLEVEERFLPEDEMRAAMARADWIVMPYSRPEYSSGILVRAAVAGTPVIGPADGLLGHLILQYGLGLVTAVDSAALSQTMASACTNVFVIPKQKREAFISQSQPALFARMLLAAGEAQATETMGHGL